MPSLKSKKSKLKDRNIEDAEQIAKRETKKEEEALDSVVESVAVDDAMSSADMFGEDPIEMTEAEMHAMLNS